MIPRDSGNMGYGGPRQDQRRDAAGPGYGNSRAMDAPGPPSGSGFARGGGPPQHMPSVAPGGIPGSGMSGGRGRGFQPSADNQWGGTGPKGPQGPGGRSGGFAGSPPGGRGDPGWSGRGRGGRYVPRGGYAGRQYSPGRGRGRVPSRGRGYDGAHTEGGRGHHRPPTQQRRHLPGEDPALLLRRKQSRAARLSRQVAPLKVSSQLAGSKLYDRWAAAAAAGGDTVDVSDGASPAQPFLSSVLEITSDNAFTLASDASEQQSALTAAAVGGIPIPGCSTVTSKFGTFLLPGEHAQALGC